MVSLLLLPGLARENSTGNQVIYQTDVVKKERFPKNAKAPGNFRRESPSDVDL